MIIDEVVTGSKTLQFSLMAQELKKQGRNIISLGLGEPNYDTPEHIKQAAADALAAGRTRYGSAAGVAALRDLVAAKLQNDNAIPARPQEVLIVPGAKNALFLAAAAVLRPGDEVLNLTPCYVSNLPILKLADPQSVIHDVPLDSETFRLDRAALLGALTDRTRLLMTNYPNNPSGKMLDEDDAVFLRELVRERDMYWISDEIYERLRLTEKRHLSPASFAEIHDKVITVNGFSKSYSMTGWRIGYTHASAALTQVMTKIHQQLNTNTAEFIQQAAIAAVTGPQERLQEFVADLKARRALLVDFCARTPGMRCSPVEGGFFGFLDVSATGFTSDEFSTRLLCETGVAVIPGVSFGERFDHWIRVSLCASTEQLTEGLQRIGEFATRHQHREVAA